MIKVEPIRIYYNKTPVLKQHDYMVKNPNFGSIDIEIEWFKKQMEYKSEL